MTTLFRSSNAAPALPRSFIIFMGIVAAVTVTVLSYGLYISGSPISQRTKQLDAKRADELSQIMGAISAFWTTQDRLPNNLDEIAAAAGFWGTPVDPGTDRPFEYVILTPTSYRLCGVFDSDTGRSKLPGQAGDFTFHAQGRVCRDVTLSAVDKTTKAL